MHMYALLSHPSASMAAAKWPINKSKTENSGISWHKKVDDSLSIHSTQKPAKLTWKHYTTPRKAIVNVHQNIFDMFIKR